MERHCQQNTLTMHLRNYILVLILLLAFPFTGKSQPHILEFEKWSAIYPNRDLKWNYSYSYISIIGNNIHWGLGEVNNHFNAKKIEVYEHTITIQGMDSNGIHITIEYNKTEDLAIVYYGKRAIYIYRLVKGYDPCKITINQQS